MEWLNLANEASTQAFSLTHSSMLQLDSECVPVWVKAVYQIHADSNTVCYCNGIFHCIYIYKNCFFPHAGGGGSDDNAGLIAGVVVGLLVFCVVVIVVIVIFALAWKKYKEYQETESKWVSVCVLKL